MLHLKLMKIMKKKFNWIIKHLVPGFTLSDSRAVLI